MQLSKHRIYEYDPPTLTMLSYPQGRFYLFFPKRMSSEINTALGFDIVWDKALTNIIQSLRYSLTLTTAIGLSSVLFTSLSHLQDKFCLSVVSLVSPECFDNFVFTVIWKKTNNMIKYTFDSRSVRRNLYANKQKH